MPETVRRTSPLRVPIRLRDSLLPRLAAVYAVVLLAGTFALQQQLVKHTQEVLEHNLLDEAILTTEALDAGFQLKGSLAAPSRATEEIEGLMRATQNLDFIGVYRDAGGRMRLFAASSEALPPPPTAAEQAVIRGGARRISRETGPEGPFWRVVGPLHSPAGGVAGAIEVRMSVQVAVDSARELRNTTRWLSLGGVVVGFLALGWFLFVWVERPVRALLRTMIRVRSGHMDARAAEAGGSEMARLGAGLNEMLERVRSSDAENRRLLGEIQEMNRDLELRVLSKTQELTERNTELLHANQLLVDMELNLARLARLAELGQFAATLAHEIGTPLHSISGHLELLRERQAIDPKEAHRLQVIQGQVDRVTQIVREVLQSTRAPLGERQRVALEPLLRELLQLLEPGLAPRGIQLSLEVEPGVSEIWANPPQLQQVFLNLLGNAFDSMPQGGRVRVSLRSGPEGGVECAIADSGSGIPRELLPRVFEPFVTSKSPGEGTGLGLSVVRELVQRHAGSVSAESVPGEGSTFRLRWPGAREEGHEPDA